MKKLLIALLPFLLTALHQMAYGQQNQFLPKGINQTPSGVNNLNWVSVEQVQQLPQKGKRKVMINICADWCSWCKKMETETLSDPEIVRYLDEEFYVVKLNSEEKDDIQFQGKTYKFVKTGPRGSNELAVELLGGRLSVPSLIFLDEDMKIIQALPGYKTPEELMPILKYFGSNEYMRTPWSAFQKTFRN